MCNSRFKAKCGCTIMRSHKIQSLWLDLKNHINMTCVGSYGLFLWSMKWSNHKVIQLFVWQANARSLFLSLFVALFVSICKWLFLCLSGCISATQEININGPSSCVSLWTPSLPAWTMSRAQKENRDCRERAGAALRSRPSRVTDVEVRPGVFSQGN